MYEELIRCLRGHSEKMGCADNCICEDAYKRGFGTCSEELAKLAADAIGELSKKRDAACWGCKCEKIEPSVWIPVTERLPKYGETVLVYGSQGGIYTARYERARTEWGRDSWWKLNSKSHICNPTHWMPLPQPPKEE